MRLGGTGRLMWDLVGLGGTGRLKWDLVGLGREDMMEMRLTGPFSAIVSCVPTPLFR
jgi:hypothetical protein